LAYKKTKKDVEDKYNIIYINSWSNQGKTKQIHSSVIEKDRTKIKRK